MPIMQAAVDGMRDSSEDKTTAICEALYAANPEGSMLRGVNDHDRLLSLMMKQQTRTGMR